MNTATELLSPSAPLTYAARDTANAPAIKAAIASRSAKRCDPDEIQAWLGSHFFRFVVGNLQADAPALLRIDTVADAQQKLGGSVPEWIDRRLRESGKHGAPAAPIWWIDPESRAVQEVEQRLLEFLSSRAGTPLEGKLMRINALQALAQWEAEHQAMEARHLSGWRTHQSQAVRLVWQGEGGEFVEMLPESPHLREEMAYESQCMRHCLGQFGNRRKLTGGYGEHYAASCEQGRMRLFSYRTGQSQPRITISALVTPGGQLEIEQIKGKQNRPPVAKYHADVRAFLQSLSTTHVTPNDALAMDLVRLPGGWTSVSDIAGEAEQLALFAQHPAKLARLRSAGPLVQWLALARTPKEFNAPPGSVLARTQELAGIERLVSDNGPAS